MLLVNLDGPVGRRRHACIVMHRVLDPVDRQPASNSMPSRGVSHNTLSAQKMAVSRIKMQQPTPKGPRQQASHSSRVIISHDIVGPMFDKNWLSIQHSIVLNYFLGRHKRTMYCSSSSTRNSHHFAGCQKTRKGQACTLVLELCRESG